MVKNVPTEFFEMTTPDGGKAINYGYRRPVGVVGVICPWNLPLLLMTWKAARRWPAATPWSSSPRRTPRAPPRWAWRGDEQGRHPQGCSTTWSNGFGANSAGAFLTAHPEVDALTFTW